MQQSLIGRTLRDGEYVIRDVLGRGGMATVYRAYARSLETDVALKVLTPAMAVNLELRERFHQEARLLSRLFHANLLTVHYFGEEGDIVYIAMRLVTGGTLRERLTAMGGTLDLVSAARLVRGVADALQTAHDAHVVHLDVKPSNVLLGRADWPLLADTGIAEVIGPAGGGGRRAEATSAQVSEPVGGGSTRRRAIVGTPAYMSPEQCRGDAVDGHSDQYSLAVMAFELLTGQLPFSGSSAEDLMRRQIEDAPPRPRELNPGLPSPIEEILLRGLSKQPADRFPSINEFGRTLAEAAERTRGMSLDTKTSLAEAAPNLVGTLALLLLGPLLLLMLPPDALLAGIVPLGWPFQVALALGLGALLLGIRWHVIGLVARAGSRLVEMDERARGGSGGSRLVEMDERARGGSGGTRRGLTGLRRAVVGSAEGVVNLVYLIGLYRLVGAPLLTLIGGLVDPTVAHVVQLGLLGVVVVASLGIVVAISRTASLQAAMLVLGVAWALTATLPSSELGLANATGMVGALRLLIGAAIVAVLVARRRPTAELVGGLVAGGLGRLLAESRPDLPPQTASTRRQHVAAISSVVLDLLYLLFGYALLRTPLTEELRLVLPPVVAAGAVTALAGLMWVALIVRLQLLAGALGLLLGLLLGAPLLLSLPILDGRFVGDVPTIASSAIAWVVGSGLLLLLIGLRGRLNDFGGAALGARLERGLLGTHAADAEDSHQRRQGAFTRIGGALTDVSLLVIAYWMVGAPLVSALVRATGLIWIGSAALAVLFAAVVGVLALAVLQTRRTLDETGGPAWRARATALALLCLVLVPIIAVSGAAAPAALATPAASGVLELQAGRNPMLVVDRDFWLPWTPGQNQATYDVALSCTDGTHIGEFRETVQPAAGAPMPAGQVGQLGRTSVACADWPVEYAARRQAAGLGDGASLSWDALDVSGTLNPDGSMDVVETHHVAFTSGRVDHIAVMVGAPAADLTQLRVSENGVEYAVDPSGVEPAHYARSWEDGEQYWIGWWFPAVVSPAERTYTIAYHLNGALQVTAEGRRGLDWRVVPPDALEPIWLATVQVKLPPGVAAESVRLAATGAAVQSGVIGSEAAWFTAAAPISGDALETRVEFAGGDPAQLALPTPTPTPTAPPTPTPTILAVSPSVAATATLTRVTASPSAQVSPTVGESPTGVATDVAGTPTVVDTPASAPTDVATPTPTPGDTTAADDVPVATDTPVATETPMAVVTDAPTAAATPTETPAPTESPTPTPPTAVATDTPTAVLATATATPIPTNTSEPTPSPTPSWTPTHTPAPTATATSTQPPTATPTWTPTATPTATDAPTATATPTWTATPTPTPLRTATPTPTPVPTAVSLQLITVAPANPVIFINQTQQMTATGRFSDGTTRDVTRSAAWSTSNAKVASVNSGGGVVGTGFGSATIRASVGSASGSTTVTVTAQIG